MDVYTVTQERACCAWNFPFFSLVIALHVHTLQERCFSCLSISWKRWCLQVFIKVLLLCVHLLEHGSDPAFKWDSLPSAIALGFCLRANLLCKGPRTCDGRTGCRKESSFSHWEEGSYMLWGFIKLHLWGGTDCLFHRLMPPICTLQSLGNTAGMPLKEMASSLRKKGFCFS